jgi:hypothetical protein
MDKGIAAIAAALCVPLAFPRRRRGACFQAVQAADWLQLFQRTAE